MPKVMDTDFAWFLEHYNQLFQSYGDSFLAIKNQKVLGKYGSYAEAVRKTKETEAPGTFIVQHCNGNESGYTNYLASMFV